LIIYFTGCEDCFTKARSLIYDLKPSSQTKISLFLP